MGFLLLVKQGRTQESTVRFVGPNCASSEAFLAGASKGMVAKGDGRSV